MQQKELDAIEENLTRKPRKGKRPKAKFVEQRQEEVANKPLVPRNEKQKAYIRMMEDPDVGLVIATGFAGTSKTYIPVVVACDLLRTGKIERIIFTRPNISNSKSLGMFKGTMVEKISLWLMPVMNILRERLGENTLELYIKRRQIDFVPMEVVKGYSAENCVFICDEAEDLSVDEAKKIVTRQGENCKMVLAGDISQSELKDKSGLKLLLEMTKRHDTLKVGTVDFNQIGDIERSDQCKNWIIAFRKDETPENKSNRG